MVLEMVKSFKIDKNQRKLKVLQWRSQGIVLGGLWTLEIRDG